MTREGNRYCLALGVPRQGFGGQLEAIRAWLDREAGRAGYDLREGDGPGGVAALHVALGDERLARAFVRRWVVARIEIPAPRLRVSHDRSDRRP